MKETYKSFVNKSIWFTIVLFCLRCILSDEKSIMNFSLYDIYGYAGEAIAFSVMIMLLYEKILWRINPFEKMPRLKRKYSGTLCTTYNGKKLEKGVKLEIYQTLLSVRVILVTDESKSKSISASVDQIHDEWQLVYCYLNVPKVNLRERSEIHYGTAMLHIDNTKEIEGEYYTDRKSRGDMKLQIENKKSIPEFVYTIGNVLQIVAIALLVVVEILLNMLKITNIWIKIILSCYVIGVILFMLFLMIPKSKKEIGFKKITIFSFCMWCVIIPIIVGLLFMVIISKVFPAVPVDDIGFWSMAICITVLSFIWFLPKLYKEKGITSRLELYSTAWITLVTILTTLFDLQNKKGAFVFLLAMYLVLQLLIKGKICKEEEKELIKEAEN